MILFFAAIIALLLITGMVWRTRHLRKVQQMQRQQLRRWVARQKVLEPALKQWMLHLSETEMQVLLELLTGYCTSLNKELGWLFTVQIEKAPLLKAELEASVGSYAQTILRALQMEEDVRAYHAYLAFDKKPTARKHRQLVQQLYAKISHQEVTAPVKNIFRRFQRKKASHKQQINAIQQAFERDPANTMALLKETLAGEADEVIQQVQPEYTPPVLSAPAATTA